jgi:hypothetical protein
LQLLLRSSLAFWSLERMRPDLWCIDTFTFVNIPDRS